MAKNEIKEWEGFKKELNKKINDFRNNKKLN